VDDVTRDKPPGSHDHKKDKTSNQASVPDPQLALIQELMRTNQLPVQRLEALETNLNGRGEQKQASAPISNAPASTSLPPAPRKKSSPTHLSSVWFEWFVGEPRAWASDDRNKRSEAKLTVAYTKLFLGSFTLIQSDAHYRDHVLEYGSDAEKQVLSFLAAKGIRAKGSSSVLKHMRELHRRGKLDTRIREHKALLAAGIIVDLSPRKTQDSLSLSGSL
jgi:hypothetical protein